MSRLGLIIQREYLQTVGKKSFIWTTVLVPVVIIVLIAVLGSLSTLHNDSKETVALVDLTEQQQFAPLIADNEDYHFVTIVADSVTVHEVYEASDYYAIVMIPADLQQSHRIGIYSSQSVPGNLSRAVEQAIRPVLREQRIASYGIEELPQIINDCDVHLDVNNVKWGADGEEKMSSAEMSSIVGLMLALFTYMFVLCYGAMIMSGVVEEKTNRIVEVIVSSCKPFELMLGKIIGVALVGFTQFAIWGILISTLTAIAASVFGISTTVDPAAIAASQGVDPELIATATQGANDGFNEALQMIMSINFPLILFCFLLYFVGGYLLFASLFAAFGSAVDQQQDTSQFMGPVMFLMVFALYAGMFSIENPNGPLAWWCSMVPFTSSITMMVRLPFDVPVWELTLSLVLLYLTAFLMLWLAARIYRTGILMYGKKFTWRDLLHWVR